MVYSSLWREAKKSTWALILVLPLLSCSNLHLSFGTLVYPKIDVSGDASFSTTPKVFDASRGYHTQQKKIKTTTIEDNSEDSGEYVGLGYNYKNYQFGLVLGNKIKGANFTSKHKYYLLYGVDYFEYSRNKNYSLTSTNMEITCRISCGYLDRLDLYETKTTEYDYQENIKIYLPKIGLYYDFEKFSIEFNKYSSYTSFNIKYSF